MKRDDESDEFYGFDDECDEFWVWWWILRLFLIKVNNKDLFN